MGLLRGQVNALAHSEYPGYCSDIVQIGFNAWHYADSNLWASLGDEIFRQLAEQDESTENRRRKLREELAQRLDQRREFDAAKEQAKAAASTLRTQLNESTARQQVSARDLIVAPKGSPEFRKQVTEVGRRLGVHDEVEQGKLLAEQMRGAVSDAEVLRRATRNRLGTLALAVAIIILLAGVGVALFEPSARDWLAAAGVVFTTVSGVVLAAMARARAGLRSLRTLSAELRAGTAEAARKRSTADIGDQLDALREAEADQQVAEVQLAEVVSRVGELGRQLTELTPGRRLYAFLADRAHGDAYKRNLGLISTIRKDFQQLVELMADWRERPDHADSGRKPVDRIVLYIDDLDRCGPRQVVEVLQAVNLLLALDLFVVVVGVDPRWLMRSLRSHYADILDNRSLVTPEDYLEKIVNIPIVSPECPPAA